ncbi:MAG: hypothetical protein H7288_15640 [Kineosporiaceae bacterium]|nr:hypothetical protein [Aeromicrobium sp.]
MNSGTKVGNLNADRVDGLNSTSFALTSGQTNSVRSSGVALDLDDNGTADTIAAIAACPSGSRLTGGGGDDYTASGTIFMNSPLDKSSWVVVSDADVSAENPSDVVAYAVCYNPRGAVSGGNFRQAGPAPLTDAQMKLIKERGAKKLH